MLRKQIMSEIIKVYTCKKIDDVEMGVLADGTSFLTGRTLSKMCGVSPSSINDWGEEVPERGDRLRGGKMADLLAAQGFEGVRLFDKIPFEDQLEVNAYPDSVCMAFLEYYAFEAGRNCTEEAKTNYRVLARKSLQDFIYRSVGYDPSNAVPLIWRQYHDRLLLNPVPLGYFSVFKETSDIVITSIREGLIVDDHTVPDISVGLVWSKYWGSQQLDDKYGARTKYPHVYPEYFPQSQANDRIEAYIYPVDSLGEFRRWLYSEYLPNKYPSYLKNKVKKGAIPASRVELLLKAFEIPILPENV
jgi:hypothetical protein